MTTPNDEQPPVKGEWRVLIEPDMPNMVSINTTELKDDGVLFTGFYLPPDDADDFADTIKKFAQHIRENGNG